MKDLKLRQVNKELAKIALAKPPERPSDGWVRTIRESLGMTTAQFSKRLGVIQQRVSALEKAEQDGAIKIKSLEKAAEALNCRLVYFLLPEMPLEEMLRKRAEMIATKRIVELAHSMELEAQPISPAEQRRQIEELARDLLAHNHKTLWDENE